MKAKLYLDDIRPKPDNFILVRDYNECIILLENGVFELVSLDYSLGFDSHTGYDVLLWLNQHPEHLPEKIRVHSTHSYGKKLMEDYIVKHFPQVELIP